MWVAAAVVAHSTQSTRIAANREVIHVRCCIVRCTRADLFPSDSLDVNASEMGTSSSKTFRKASGVEIALILRRLENEYVCRLSMS
jgi:hypothetical protein